MRSAIELCYFTHIWIYLIYIEISKTQWISGTPLLPRDDVEMAAGAYNGTITLIGGSDYPYQLLHYDTNAQSLTDVGDTALQEAQSGGEAHFWTQQGDIVYMIDTVPHTDTRPSTFNIFNLSNNQYTTNWKSITFNAKVHDSGCLASSASFLYVVGGSDTTDEPLL
eukprot:772125_1